MVRAFAGKSQLSWNQYSHHSRYSTNIKTGGDRYLSDLRVVYHGLQLAHQTRLRT